MDDRRRSIVRRLSSDADRKCDSLSLVDLRFGQHRVKCVIVESERRSFGALKMRVQPLRPVGKVVQRGVHHFEDRLNPAWIVGRMTPLILRKHGLKLLPYIGPACVPCIEQWCAIGWLCCHSTAPFLKMLCVVRSATAPGGGHGPICPSARAATL